MIYYYYYSLDMCSILPYDYIAREVNKVCIFSHKEVTNTITVINCCLTTARVRYRLIYVSLFRTRYYRSRAARATKTSQQAIKYKISDFLLTLTLLQNKPSPACCGRAICNIEVTTFGSFHNLAQTLL